MATPPSEAIRRGDWFVLLDPGWTPDSPQAPPPNEVIVGGWEVTATGAPGPFRPNPGYRPLDPAGPTDPIDAVLRQIAEGQQLGQDLVDLLADSIVEVACDDNEQPLPATAPDDTECLVVATAAAQKDHIDCPAWRAIQGSKLPRIAPPGTDIFLNPAGAAPFRLLTEALGSVTDAAE